MTPSRVLGAAALVALAIVPWVLARHQVSLLTDLLIFGLFAMSLDLILGYTGMLSFARRVLRPGRVCERARRAEFAQPVPVAAPGRMVLAGAVALPVGWFSTRSTGMYFAMLTLAFAQFLYTVAYKWRSLTGGSDASRACRRPRCSGAGPAWPRRTRLLPGRRLRGALARALRALVRSPFGRALQAIRENERRFTSLGRDPRRSARGLRPRRCVRRPGQRGCSRRSAGSPRRR